MSERDADGVAESSGGATRRRFLAGASGAAVAATAGCLSVFTGDGNQQGDVSFSDFRGSGPLVQSRPKLEGTSMDDLTPLSGTLTVYLGGGEGGLYLDLLDLLTEKYPEFDYKQQLDDSATLTNRIINEANAGNVRGDVFLSVDAGSVGAVTDTGATEKLPESIREPVPDHYQAAHWVGFAGRARSVPYNTDQYSASELPSSIDTFATADRFAGAMGWAPTYGAFQSFVTAMRHVRGKDGTRQWLNAMQSQQVDSYADEFKVSNAVAEGALGAGFANHYYALRVRNARPDAPIDLAFTKNDAGALVNVSAASVLQGTDQQDLARNLVRHLLTVEAQEFFATRTFAYPMIPGVPPVGDLPTIDELNPPDVDLTALSDLQPTIELLQQTGVL
ncbi:MAG: extracellular solute-binding protein [Haloarculaceae archaeon]